MISGISGMGSYQYLSQLRQAGNQGTGSLTSQFFNLLDTNGDGSVSKDEFSAFQSVLASQLQSTQSTSQGGSTEFLMSLLQSANQTGSTGSTTTATASSSSQQSTLDGIFNRLDTNGDGSISKTEFENALSGMGHHHHHGHGSAGASTQAGSSTSLADQLFAQIDTNNDGSISKDELTAFQSTLEAQLQSSTTGSTTDPLASLATGTAGLTSFIQQAITKYMQLSPAGAGITGVSSLLGTA